MHQESQERKKISWGDQDYLGDIHLMSDSKEHHNEIRFSLKSLTTKVTKCQIFYKITFFREAKKSWSYFWKCFFIDWSLCFACCLQRFLFLRTSFWLSQLRQQAVVILGRKICWSSCSISEALLLKIIEWFLPKMLKQSSSSWCALLFYSNRSHHSVSS